MGFYSVLKPCVVGKLHYATVPVQPIEVDDDVAAPLIEAGSLKQYQPGCYVAPQLSPLGWTEDAKPSEVGPYAESSEPVDDEPPTNPPPPRARSSRRPKD